MTPAALAVRETAVPVTTPSAARSWAGLLVLLVGTVAVRALRHDAPDVVERAVAWSGSQSGKAWFFGTLDPGAATSVGAPAAGWLPGLSLRVCGTADLAVLATVLTVLAVAVLAATVRRVAGPAAGLVAGAVQALLLRTGGEAQTALLLGVAGYCLVRPRGRGRWVGLAGVAGGGAVLTGGWTGLVGVALLAATLVLRGTVPRRGVRDVVVLCTSAAAPVGTWFLLAPWWSGGGPVSSGVWSGPVAGLVAPTVATVLALGGAWWRQRRAGASRVGVVVALLLAVGLSATAPADAPSPVDTTVASLLEGAGTTWSAATVGSPRTAAALELASGTAVLTLGTDDSAVSLARFQSYVATGRVRYLLVPGGTTSAVVDRVAASHTATTVGATTVYDLSD